MSLSRSHPGTPPVAAACLVRPLRCPLSITPRYTACRRRLPRQAPQVSSLDHTPVHRQSPPPASSHPSGVLSRSHPGTPPVAAACLVRPLRCPSLDHTPVHRLSPPPASSDPSGVPLSITPRYTASPRRLPRQAPQVSSLDHTPVHRQSPPPASVPAPLGCPSLDHTPVHRQSPPPASSQHPSGVPSLDHTPVHRLSPPPASSQHPSGVLSRSHPGTPAVAAACLVPAPLGCPSLDHTPVHRLSPPPASSQHPSGVPLSITPRYTASPRRLPRPSTPRVSLSRSHPGTPPVPAACLVPAPLGCPSLDHTPVHRQSPPPASSQHPSGVLSRSHPGTPPVAAACLVPAPLGCPSLDHTPVHRQSPPPASSQHPSGVPLSITPRYTASPRRLPRPSTPRVSLSRSHPGTPPVAAACLVPAPLGCPSLDHTPVHRLSPPPASSQHPSGVPLSITPRYTACRRRLPRPSTPQVSSLDHTPVHRQSPPPASSQHPSGVPLSITPRYTASPRRLPRPSTPRVSLSRSHPGTPPVPAACLVRPLRCPSLDHTPVHRLSPPPASSQHPSGVPLSITPRYTASPRRLPRQTPQASSLDHTPVHRLSPPPASSDPSGVLSRSHPGTPPVAAVCLVRPLRCPLSITPRYTACRRRLPRQTPHVCLSRSHPGTPPVAVACLVTEPRHSTVSQHLCPHTAGRAVAGSARPRLSAATARRRETA